ncbi:MAG: PcfJ domain-containing protein [Thermodesulfobacteriota bacterium]|nr:PcfJ domain-containing protein [Thermodesulfobacteriota bacterium]
MRPEILNRLKKKLPRPFADILLGDKPFATFDEACSFAAIFYSLSKNEAIGNRSISRDDWHILYIEADTKGITGTDPVAIGLADWFVRQMASRLSLLLEDRLAFLGCIGFTAADAAELILIHKYLSLYRFFMANSYVQDDLPSVRSFREAFQTSRLHERAGAAVADIKTLALQFPLHCFPALLRILETRTVELTVSDIYNRLKQYASFQVDEDPIAKCDRFQKESLQCRRNSQLPSVFDRVQQKGDALWLYFIRKNNLLWYRVAAATGRITGPDSEQAAAPGYHMALRRFGYSCSALHRGRKDILLAFLKNAMDNISVKDRPHLNTFFLRGLLMEAPDRAGARFLEHVNAPDLARIKQISRRYAIQWELYGLYRAYGRQSVEMFSVQEFHQAFPSLMQIVYPGFVTRYVVPGKPLKKVLPYWSSSFRAEAAKPSENYREAHARLMAAINQDIGARGPLDAEQQRACFHIAGFKNPFASMPRYKERFLVWMQNTPDSLAYDCRSLYDFVLQTGHVVSGKTTGRSLQRRHDQWVRQLNDAEANADAQDTGGPFPAPWLPAHWADGDAVVRHIATPAELADLGRQQENCVHSYGTDIRKGRCHIYALAQAGQYLATIEIEHQAEQLVMTQCRGARNQPLQLAQQQIVQRWCKACRIESTAINFSDAAAEPADEETGQEFPPIPFDVSDIPFHTDPALALEDEIPF